MVFRYCRSITWALALLAIAVNPVLGQTVRSGSIAGTVTDESGGVLPGVTVTVAGPALQVPQLSRTTDAKGEYSFANLPIGAYTVEYDLTGFGKVVRQDV